MPADIADALQSCRCPDGMLAAELSGALAAELPAFKRDGGFVREGYDASLDETRALRDESRRVVAALQARYAEDTGVRGLKIRHNNVLGYFVEVTAQHGDKLTAAPLNATFIHRQTLAGQVRFTTTELGELEAKIASAADRALGLELEIFERLTASVIAQAAPIKECAEALAQPRRGERARPPRRRARLCASARSTTATTSSSKAAAIRWSNRRWRATARRSSPTIAICRRRRTTSPRRRPHLADHRPQHGGQVHLPAPERADRDPGADGLVRAGEIAPISAWSTGCSRRVGAADDLARGRSTFMVEMVETAAILNQAGRRSLVILDEIGRGTATFDGLSIAWATVEHLHDVNKCRALFATHFHELTALSRPARPVAQRHGASEGMAGRRGVPARSHRRLGRPFLRHPGGETRRPAGERDRARQDWCWPNWSRRTAPSRRASRTCRCSRRPTSRRRKCRTSAFALMLAAVAALNPDEMSPREAMEALYRLKPKLAETEKK